MHTVILFAGLAAMALGAAAPKPTPEQVWAAAIAAQNKSYAEAPHAMLKIQDSVYLGDGESAVLQGRKGEPASWHWSRDAKARGPLGIAVKGGKLAVTRDGKAIDPGLIAKNIGVDTNVDVGGQATQVGAGIEGWRLFVYNQMNPAARDFKGVSYFPYDPAFRVTARFKPDAALPPRVFNTSRGTTKQFYHVGDAAFTLEGKKFTLPFYAESNDPKRIDGIMAFYTDELTGKGAYGAGRYLDVKEFGSYPPKTVAIDFNRSFNPNCARSAHFTCPVTIDNIAFAIKAGERDPHSAH